MEGAYKIQIAELDQPAQGAICGRQNQLFKSYFLKCLNSGFVVKGVPQFICNRLRSPSKYPSEQISNCCFSSVCRYFKHQAFFEIVDYQFCIFANLLIQKAEIRYFQFQRCRQISQLVSTCNVSVGSIQVITVLPCKSEHAQCITKSWEYF